MDGSEQESKPRIVITKFNANFKQIVVRAGDGTALLDFEAEPDQMADVASLLKVIGLPFLTQVNEVLVPSMVRQIRFDGNGKSVVRLVTDTLLILGSLTTLVDKVVTLEVTA